MLLRHTKRLLNSLTPEWIAIWLVLLLQIAGVIFFIIGLIVGNPVFAMIGIVSIGVGFIISEGLT